MFLIRSYLAVLTPVLLFVPFRAILLNFISNFCNRDARHWKPTCEARVCKGNRYQVKEDRISCKAASVFRSGFHKKQAGKHNDFQCLSSSVKYVCVLFIHRVPPALLLLFLAAILPLKKADKSLLMIHYMCKGRASLL